MPSGITKCSLCKRADREDVDRIIVSGGENFEEIGIRLGCGASTVSRHVKHITALQKMVIQGHALKEARSVVSRMADLADKAEAALSAAENEGNGAAVAAFIREARQTYKDYSEMLDKGKEASVVVEIVDVSVPDFCPKCKYDLRTLPPVEEA